MGLDTTHDCWSGSYISFHSFREALAEAAGLPRLVTIEGFASRPRWRWEDLPEDPIIALLNHSDCEGELPVEVLIPLADRLDELAEVLDAAQRADEDSFGGWGPSAPRFAEGCRRAAAEGVPVEFH